MYIKKIQKYIQNEKENKLEKKISKRMKKKASAKKNTHSKNIYLQLKQIFDKKCNKSIAF